MPARMGRTERQLLVALSAVSLPLVAALVAIAVSVLSDTVGRLDFVHVARQTGACHCPRHQGFS